jgi:hypothetical protein
MEVSRQLHVPAALSPGKQNHGINQIGRREGSCVEEKTLVSARNRTLAVQPVARLCSYWAHLSKVPVLNYAMKAYGGMNL